MELSQCALEPRRELNLRLLVESIPAPVAVMTPSGEVEAVNKPNLEYFGKTLEDLRKWGSSDAVHPDDLPQAIEIWMEAIYTGQPYDVKQRLRRFDGVYRWFEVRGFPLRGPDGQILNWCVLLTDIDDQQRAEEALRRSEAHLSQAQRLAHVGSWVWQVAGRKTVYLSEEWYRIYGFDPKVGMPAWEERLQRVHPEDRAKWQAAIDRAIEEKSDYDLEVRILLPDGAVRYVHSVGHPVLGSLGELVQFVGVSMDVTERKQADEAFRLIVVGTAASRVVKDVARASEIIGRVRSLFKKDSLQREEVDINELIQEMIALLGGEAARHSISIHSDLSLDLPPIMADRVQLQQVLMNLMLNSIEAMNSMNTPGKLTIKSRQDDGSQLVISVMDTGVGVPPEKIEQIFNAFFTSKPQGSGMGLAISRSIIESHGGRLWATPNKGPGAIFHFTLPTRPSCVTVPLSITLSLK